jgi:titin
MTLSWQPPPHDGGSALRAYIIEKRDTQALTGWARVDKVRSHIYSYTVTNLLPAHKYFFRIIAENDIGRSEALETRTPVEAKSPYTPPEAPGTVRLAGVTDSSISIEWRSPHSDGGSQITGYVVEKRETHSSIWSHVASVGSHTHSYTLQNLYSSCAYFIRVAAENEEGIGQFRDIGEPVRPTSPRSLPHSPRSVVPERIARDSVTLRWEPPEDTGGVPLSAYIVEKKDSKKNKWDVVSYVSPQHTYHTVDKLIQGWSYDFRVRAENSDGIGAARGLRSSVIPRPLVWKPSAPQLLEVSNLSEDSVTLSWMSPINDGGARVFRYVVELRDLSRAEGWTYVKEVDSSDILVACIEGLKEGKPYQFRVYAENEVGAGPAAELRDSVIPKGQLGAPSPPEGPLRVIRVNRNMVDLHWRPPIDNGGSPIEQYIIEKREADRSHWTQAGTCSPDVTAISVTGLQENQLYYFRVLAENAYGFSDPLDFDRPIIPKRIFESAHEMELDSWIREAYVEPTEATRILQRVSGRYERAYSAYADEPLTTTFDSLGSLWSSRL